MDIVDILEELDVPINDIDIDIDIDIDYIEIDKWILEVQGGDNIKLIIFIIYNTWKLLTADY